MALDPIHRLQVLARRRGKPRGAARELEGVVLERILAVGEKQIARLADEIEVRTGCSLEARSALDFGCGRGRLAIPLAARCKHVYGLDIRPAILRQAAHNAERQKVDNVEWIEAARLPELNGRYDMVLSFHVFQHIPPREGERILTTLLAGMRPGGVGAIHLTLRRSDSASGWLRWVRANSSGDPSKSSRGLHLSFPYMLMTSYSLNRVGRIFAGCGIADWHTNWHSRSGPVDAVTIIFRKADPAARTQASNGQRVGRQAAQPDACL
jgi:2-polyprenyl-3-methyl-5-hydroxy-6-metoxy-1,4-benzoquinol methylase